MDTLGSGQLVSCICSKTYARFLHHLALPQVQGIVSVACVSCLFSPAAGRSKDADGTCATKPQG